MRKTHCACLLLGLLLGMPLGVGLVVMHMKYGQGPLVAVDTSPAAVQETVLEEPQPDGEPLGDDGWATADQGQPAGDGNPLVLAPIGPVEVTVVQRTHSRSEIDGNPAMLAQAALADEASRRESCERRMLQHLLRHVQTATQQPCQSEVAEEPPPPAQDPLAELAQPEAPEPLPMPTAEPEAAVIPPPDERFSAPIAYPKPKLNVPSEPAAPPAPPQEVSPARNFDDAMHHLAVPGRTPYTGAYQSALREDRKLQLPAEVCDMLVGGLPQTLYLVPLQHRVRLYTPRGLKNLLQTLQQMGYWNMPNQHEQAVLMSCIRRVEVADDGKLKIPAELAKFGGLKNKVVLVGVYDHVELWDADAWREAVTAVLPDAEALALPADQDGEAVPEVPHD